MAQIRTDNELPDNARVFVVFDGYLQDMLEYMSINSQDEICTELEIILKYELEDEE